MFPRSDISEQNAPVSNPVFDEKKPKNGNHGYVLWTKLQANNDDVMLMMWWHILFGLRCNNLSATKSSE